MSKLVQAIIYARVSTHDQDCARQIADLTAWAEKSGYQIVAVVKETASGADDKRAERAKVIEAARRRKINAVLVTELSRWGRSLPDLINTLEELHGYGVSLLTHTGFQFDLSTAQGRLIAGIMSALSEFERELLVERVKSGIANARSRGKRIGRQPGQVIRPHPLTPQILELVSAGVSYRKVADKLKISKTTVQTITNKAKVQP